ncbi:MAG: hypothetical protein QS748_00960 [Candidatus Endonucleobacter bathymodioli]|uniref:Uncharacterized protein n=1 Tax=Candidatus Endonucleibacter bathymodioli TaxID=539814 RepID=A0AA90NP35_9GAMM|nr:hypothetical protein [Candidatus Endonucleobacter bathymodioli]
MPKINQGRNNNFSTQYTPEKECALTSTKSMIKSFFSRISEYKSEQNKNKNISLFNKSYKSQLWSLLLKRKISPTLNLTYSKYCKSSKKLASNDNTASNNDRNRILCQAKHLVGAYSQTLNREWTISDFGLTQNETIRLLGTYSFALKRSFSHNDLKLSSYTLPSPDIDPDIDQSMPANVTPLSESKAESTDTGDIFQYNQSMGIDKPTNYLSFKKTTKKILSKIFNNIFSAQKRLNKVRIRSRNIMKATDVQTRWKNINITTKQMKKQMDKNQFSDLASLCFLEREQSEDYLFNNESLNNARIKQILSADKEYLSDDRLQKICSNIVSLMQGTSKEKEQQLEWLKNFSTLDNHKNNDSFFDNKQINNAKKILSHYGINLSFRHDRFLGRFRPNSKTNFHRIKINNKKLHQVLQHKNKLPKVKLMKELLNTHEKNINALGRLKNYDINKIRHHLFDRNIKLIAGFLNIIPFISVADALKSYAYKRITNYRKTTKKLADRRIHESLDKLPELLLESTEKDEIEKQLKQVKQLKIQHSNIKQQQSIANSTIHATSFIASTPLLLTGIVGSLINFFVSVLAKKTTLSAGAINRSRKDTYLRNNHQYTTVKDIYQNYKKLYLSAKKQNDTDKMKAIATLVKIGFGIDHDTLDTLVNSNLIENNQFKLSFSYTDDLSNT